MQKIIPTLSALLCIAVANVYGADADTTKPADAIGAGNSHLFKLEKSGASTAVSDGPHWIEVKGGKWHLGDSELATMQQKLRQFFGAPQDALPSPTADDPFGTRKAAAAKSSKEEISTRWQTYSIQYQGQHSFEGQFVKIEGSCMSGDGPELREEFAVISDGGACIFNVKYNPVTQQFFDFAINGYA